MNSLSATLATYLTTDPYWTWLIVAAVLIAIEVLLPTSWLLWPALAAATLGIITYIAPEAGWAVQIVGFIALAFGFTWLGRKYVRSNPLTSNSPHLNKKLDAMVGRRSTTLDDGADGFNRIRLDDTVWQVKSEDGAALHKDMQVEITGSNGGTLNVRRVLH